MQGLIVEAKSSSCVGFTILYENLKGKLNFDEQEVFVDHLNGSKELLKNAEIFCHFFGACQVFLWNASLEIMFKVNIQKRLKRFEKIFEREEYEDKSVLKKI